MGFDWMQDVKIYVLLMTFEYPRKSYLNAREYMTVGHVWRSGCLSAGEVGTDDLGEYQVFVLTDKGRKFMEDQETT